MGQCKHLKIINYQERSIFSLEPYRFWCLKMLLKPLNICFVFYILKILYSRAKKKYDLLEDSGKFLLRSRCCASIFNDIFYFNIFKFSVSKQMFWHNLTQYWHNLKKKLFSLALVTWFLIKETFKTCACLLKRATW